MEYVFSAIGGVSCKAYDDIVDNHIEVSDTLKEALKGIQWISLAVLSINDFNFTLYFYIFNYLHHLTNKESFSLPYEHSLLYVYPLLLLFNYHTAQSFNSLDLIPVLSACAWFTLEPYFFPENMSYRKILCRILLVITIIIVLAIGVQVGSSDSMRKILIYLLCYMSVSLVFQGLLISGLVKRKDIPEEDAPASEEAEEGKAIPNPSNT